MSASLAQIGFTVEMFIRIIAMGFWDRDVANIPRLPKYLNDDWNKLDFFVVISSWLNVVVEVTGIELGVELKSLRATRIMRVLKAFKNIKGIRQILGTIGTALPYSLNVMAFLAFLFVVMGIIGIQMFKGLGRHRCEYSTFDLQVLLNPDKFPLTDSTVPFDVNGTLLVGGGMRDVLGTAPWDGNRTVSDGASHPWPQPPLDVDPDDAGYEYPIGIGMWITYCTVDEDCPLYDIPGPYNRTQTCQPSLNPGKGFQNYDSIGDAWIALFINMANLYWWETAHRFADANNGLGSSIAWGFGMFNVFFLTYVTVNMFVAVITTVFMDVRSAQAPDEGVGGGEAAVDAVTKRDNMLAARQEEADAWKKPFYYIGALGGRSPFEEHESLYGPESKEQRDITSRQGVINQKWFDQFILGFIGLNTIVLAAEHHDRSSCKQMQVDELCQSDDFIQNNIYANYLFNFVFTMECLMKIFGMGFRQYIKPAFNKLDFFIVVTSALDMLGEAMAEEGEGSSFAVFKMFRIFRLFRVLRVARILYKNKNLKRVLLTVFGSGEALANLVLFIFFACLIFSIGGMHLLSGGYHPENADWGYGNNSGSLWGRLTGDGVYDVRHFAKSRDSDDGLMLGSYRYGYDVQEFIRKGLIPRRNFEDFPRAFLLAFQVMTGDDWVNQMHDNMEMAPGFVTPALFFLNFGFCNFILLSLFIAVILENFEIAEKEKMELQKEKMKDDKYKAEMSAKKPSISFVHRLVWLVGGEGKKPGTLFGIGDGVALDVGGLYSGNAQDKNLWGTVRTVNNPLTKDEVVVPALNDMIINWECEYECQKDVFRALLEGIEPGTSEFEPALKAKLAELDREGLGALGKLLCMAPTEFGIILPGEKWYNDDKSLFALGPDHPFRQSMVALAENNILELMVLVAILLGTGFLAYEGPPDSLPKETQTTIDRCNDVLFAIFMVEFLSKVIGYGFMFTPASYLKNPWNKLDFIVIAGSIVNYLGGNAGFVRLLRCLRPLRIINRNEGMRVIISAVINSLAVNVGVLALSSLGLLMFGILGVSVFAGSMWSCNCGYSYPGGLNPTNTMFTDTGGWVNISSGELCKETNRSSLFFDSNSMAGGCRPQLVSTEQQCIGELGDTTMYGIDPSFPDTVSQCYWDNRPYNFDTTQNAMMSLFTASTLAGWTDIMEVGMDSTGIGRQPVPFSGAWAGKCVYFLMYIMIMAFFVTNLFIGVLIDFIGNSDGTALLTEEQQELLDLSKFQKIHRPSLRDEAPPNPIRKWFYNLVESKFWDKLSNAAIVFNVGVMMCEYEDQTQSWADMQDNANSLCLYFFTVEMFLKIIAYMPIKYLADPWSKFDVVVISLSWAAIIFEVSGAQAIRAMRALRIILVLKTAKGIRSLFQTLILSIAPAINISVLVLLLYMLYAIMGMMLFGNVAIQDIECATSPTDQAGTQMMHNPACAWKSEDASDKFAGIAGGGPGQMLMGLNRQYTTHSSFRNFKDSMGLLFQCAAGQDWKFVMYAVGGEPCGYDCKDPESTTHGLAFLYFASFFFFSNYILLNLFVAVILDNFASSMREQELGISEADFEEFKYAFRDQTSDKTPELLPYNRLWKVMCAIGELDGHMDDGDIIENALAPPPVSEWTRTEFVAWKVAKGRPDGDKCSDVKALLHDLYFQNDSPIITETEKVGISFGEHWEALLETPCVYECTPEVDMPEDTISSKLATELQFTYQNVTEWEEYRKNGGTGSCSYTTILYAVTTLRSRMRFQNLLDELNFHGHRYLDEDSVVKYDDMLQALVNLNCGDAALSLEDQMARMAREQGREEEHGLAANQRNLMEMQTDLTRRLQASKLNGNISQKEKDKIAADLEKVEASLKEHEDTNNDERAMELVQEGMSATKAMAAELQEKQLAAMAAGEEVVVEAKKKTRAAILGGLKSGAQETAVAKMEKGLAEPEPAAAAAASEDKAGMERINQRTISGDDDET